MKYPKAQLIKPKPAAAELVPIDTARLLSEAGIREALEDSSVIAPRRLGNLEDRAIYLNQEKYDWVLVQDNRGELCLVPLKKVK